MENNEVFPIQGNDPRPNGEKPEQTWQEAYDIETADGGTMRVLAVHVGADATTPVYFRGIPEAYKGGAVKRDNLAADFVGDPVAAVKPGEVAA